MVSLVGLESAYDIGAVHFWVRLRGLFLERTS